MARRALCIFLSLLSLFLVGTVVVLTTVVQYFGVDSHDIITEKEMLRYEAAAARLAVIGPAPETSALDVVVESLLPSQLLTTEPIVEESEIEQQDEEEEENLSSSLPLLADLEDRTSLSDATRKVDYLEKRGWGHEGLPKSEEDGVEPVPRIPKIIHATWKSDVVPEKWKKVRQGCMDIHPDYEFKLWSDGASRDFIAQHYPWFLTTFDGYTYPIQRADAIRYFVLHKYGGIYMDLDVGCRRSLDPLMYFQVVLPATIPVGVSNDVMLAEKEHPFMDLVIHSLMTFDHSYGTNYPTVMFSTGPMFLSAQYGLWPKDDDAIGSERDVRILPRRWYGKNAPAEEMQDSFFDHYYGSSWHADDAGFITFLGKFGIALMYTGLAVVILGSIRLGWNKARSHSKFYSPRPLGPIALPYHIPTDVYPFRPGTPGSVGVSRSQSPYGSRSGTPNLNGRRRSSDAGITTPVPKGAMYFLPVWFFPSDRSHQHHANGPSTPTQPSGWSQYMPGLPFNDNDEESGVNRYEALPPFSRPASPSNNSILNAPGMHDGAFDGVHLHSIHRASTASDASELGSPASSHPPAYSAIKNWRPSFLKSYPFSKASPVLPTTTPKAFSSSHQATLPSSTTSEPVYSNSFSSSSTSSSSPAPPSTPRTSALAGHTIVRARSPLVPPPPQYEDSIAATSYAVAELPHHDPRGSVMVRRGSTSGSAGDKERRDQSLSRCSSVSSCFIDSHEEDEEGGVEEEDEEEEEEEAMSTTSFTSEYRSGRNHNTMGTGGPVEEEVDRLLNEMTPRLSGKENEWTTHTHTH